MEDYKLKLILSILGGIVFSFIFILLAFALPSKKPEVLKKPANRLEAVSQSFKEK